MRYRFVSAIAAAALMALPAAAVAQAINAGGDPSTDRVCWQIYERAKAYDQSQPCGMSIPCLDRVRERYEQAERECHEYTEAAIARYRAQAEAAAYGLPTISREQAR